MTLQHTLFFGCMRKQYVCASHQKRRKKCVCVCSRKHKKSPRILSLTHCTKPVPIWCSLYYLAFILPLRFCVAWSLLCSREPWSPDPALSHVLRLLFILFCMFGSVYLCLSDPRVTPSPASSLPTPYQTRERTLDARMYNSHQFSFSLSLHSR